MKELITVVDVGGKAMALATIASGMMASVALERALKPVPMNKWAKMAATFFIGAMIQDYTMNKAFKFWGASKKYKVRQSEMDEFVKEFEGGSMFGSMFKPDGLGPLRPFGGRTPVPTEKGPENGDSGE